MVDLRKKIDIGTVLRTNAVTIMFIVLCIVCMYFSGLTVPYVMYELFGRLSRNAFIVLALILPIVAGMGINFAITIGAMAAQIGLLLTINWGVTGVPGILVPIIIGVIMRFPQGSGTTAMITGSAIIAPMMGQLGINPYLAALALCLTTMCPSYLNDSYFHVVTNFSGMDIKTSLKTWSIGSILVPAFGSIILIILSLFIH